MRRDGSRPCLHLRISRPATLEASTYIALYNSLDPTCQVLVPHSQIRSLLVCRARSRRPTARVEVAGTFPCVRSRPSKCMRHYRMRILQLAIPAGPRNAVHSVLSGGRRQGAAKTFPLESRIHPLLKRSELGRQSTKHRRTPLEDSGESPSIDQASGPPTPHFEPEVLLPRERPDGGSTQARLHTQGSGNTRKPGEKS